MALQDFVEEVQVLGRDLVDKVKSLVHEGNVRRIIIKDVHGNTFMEIPVSVSNRRRSGARPCRRWGYLGSGGKIHDCCEPG